MLSVNLKEKSTVLFNKRPDPKWRPFVWYRYCQSGKKGDEEEQKRYNIQKRKKYTHIIAQSLGKYDESGAENTHEEKPIWSGHSAEPSQHRAHVRTEGGKRDNTDPRANAAVRPGEKRKMLPSYAGQAREM